jgi:predicted metal-dependent phosphoesterase TrpH
LALERDVQVLALTDHDTVGGVAEAQQAAVGTGLEVISGVEISSEGEWGDLHILGYYVDPTSDVLQELMQAMRDARLGRARKMVQRLAELGMPLEWEEVQSLAGGDSVGRPHVARALLHRGYVVTLQDAFDRYLANGGPAHVPRLKVPLSQVIQTILKAGGVPVLAHPGHYQTALERLPKFVGYGLRGLEVYYPDHTPHEIESLLRLCREHDLLATGGTDFHGPGAEEGAPLGSIDVPSECVDRLREARRTLLTGEADLASTPRA